MADEISTQTTPVAAPVAAAPALPAKYPPRFVLAGVLLNVFQATEGKSRDTGEAYGGDWRAQLMSADHLRNGETKLTPTDVSIGTDQAFVARLKAKIGQTVNLPVTVYVSQNQVRCTLAEGRGR